jgi:hypothetical protein
MSPREQLTTDGFALTSRDAAVHTDGTLDRLPDSLIGDVRVSVTGSGTDDLFVGIASADDVRAYLGDVRHDTLLEVRDGDPVYSPTVGGAPQAPPTDQEFWVAQDTGTDPELTWTLDDGDWTVVLMNTDGSAAVTADIAAGAEVPMVSTLIAVLLVLAALCLLGGALLVAVPIRSASRRVAP